MSVYQTICKTQLTVGYDRYKLEEGQLVASNNPVLTKFFAGHPAFKEIFDDKLIRLAPPLHMIRDPQDPYRMRKTDMINELRSYGISVDPYEFADTITMRLTVARKMLRRNFVTVLNDEGYPIFIDKLQIQPTVSVIDKNLPEPDEPSGEFYQLDEEDELLGEIERREEVVKKMDRKCPNPEPLSKNVTMSIDPVIDDSIEINKGMEYSDFLRLAAENEFKRTLIEKEKQERDLGKQDDEKVKIDKLEVTDKEVFEEEEEPSKESSIKNEDIVEQNFKYLVEMTDNGRLFLEDISKVEMLKIRKVKWSKISVDVLSNILRVYGKNVECEESDNLKRWAFVAVVKEMVKEAQDPDKLCIEINLLQKRFDEICKLEPSYRDFTDITLKRRVTELTKYGIEGWYKEKGVRSLSKKIFQIAKLGLQVPDNEDAIDELLRVNFRTKFIK